MTGPATTTKGIISIFDIFGYFDQTLQGADILATGGGASQQYRLFMPDWFKGKPCPVEWWVLPFQPLFLSSPCTIYIIYILLLDTTPIHPYPFTPPPKPTPPN